MPSQKKHALRNGFRVSVTTRIQQVLCNVNNACFRPIAFLFMPSIVAQGLLALSNIAIANVNYKNNASRWHRRLVHSTLFVFGWLYLNCFIWKQITTTHYSVLHLKVTIANFQIFCRQWKPFDVVYRFHSMLPRVVHITGCRFRNIGVIISCGSLILVNIEYGDNGYLVSITAIIIV